MTPNNQLKVAVIGGLGLMASPMAKHWKNTDAIKVLRVHDRGTLSPRKDICRKSWQEANVSLASTFEELVGQDKLDGVFICAGKNGDDLEIIAKLASLLAQTSPNSFICHLSTVSSNFVKAAYEYCANKKIQYVNYPLTGGPKGAENASMLILAGGNEAIFDKLKPALSLIGKPKYFGPNITAGTEVKLIGHLMVFNGLIGICSAVAAHTESFNAGELGGKKQAQFFDFLNEGAGGTKQWDVIARPGIENDIWNMGFPMHYAVIDAIYTAQMCIDYNLSWLVIDSIINVALTFSFVINKVNPDLATHAIVKEMLSERALGLDQFLMQHSAPQGESKIALDKCIESLPEQIQNKVKLEITAAEFEKVSLAQLLN